MNHIERDMAALSDAEADRLPTYPIACGVNRKLLGDNVTYSMWCKDPKIFANGFIAGQKYFDFDFAIGLMDLSVMAGDLGAHVRMDDENTPFVDKHIVHSLEDYEKLEVPDIRKGRSHVIVEGTRLFNEKLKNEVICAAFLEGPLLALTQTAGAERVFMDMFTDPSAVHAGLRTMVEFDRQMVEAFSETGVAGLVWDYLWGNYSCLGDEEYNEFEGCDKYAGMLNKLTADSGMALCIHNCADLPHLDTQVKKFKPVIYSMAYYPLIPDSPSAGEVIDKGYADNCLIAGNIDPQMFIRAKTEKISKVTSDLCQEVKTALCRRGLKSRYCIASGCEVPPDRATKLDNIKAVVDTVKRDGVLEGC
ncbi:MAG: uroporphyrinogen decarboxylase [Candidatus Methanomethylophilaceae archaeon]|nr:uroporphyrinogen decarboxylase [Candidatus Methanomethylophilaceae archaeon]MDI3541682.1 uroporphyrinogen decarboxylase [Candidatus Methanomethylophilaceae archaeon]